MCWQVPLLINTAFGLAQSAQQLRQNKNAASATTREARQKAGEAARQAGLYEQDAREAIEDGERERQRYRQDFQNEQGGRLAAQGASGLDVNSASTRDFLSAAAAEAAERAGGIRLEAARQAGDYNELARASRLRAVNYRNQGRLARWETKQGNKKLLLGSLAGLGSAVGDIGRAAGWTGFEKTQ